MGIEYRNIQPDHRIQQWRKFLWNPQNKKQLVRVVTEELQKEGFRQRLTGEHLCTTTEESCVEISADYFQTKRRSDVNSRGSRHQTSCSRISSSQEWFQGCCYIIRRYDVFLLCLAFAPNDQSYVLDDSDVNSDSTIPPTRIEAFELLAEDDVRVLIANS